MSDTSRNARLYRVNDGDDFTEHASGEVYRCPVWLLPESDGRYSVLAATLLGCASQGDTEAEALANITEALQGCIEAYKADGGVIPWKALVCPQKVPFLRRVVVVRLGGSTEDDG